MLFRVVDIETVPDLTVWTPGSLKWSLRPRRQEPGPVYFKHADPEFVCEEPFPPPQANRVVALAWCDVEMRDTPVKEVGDVSVKSYEFVECHSNCDYLSLAHERNIIREFGVVMETNPATLVTWNGRGFDLPVLAMRAFHWGVPWGWYYDNKDYRYRYSDVGHVDLMDFISDYGAARHMKLDDVAHLIGLPGKAASDGFDGSQVAVIVEWGQTRKSRIGRNKIARYCLQDVLQTALIFLRTRYHLGILDAEGYERSLGTFSGSKKVKEAITVDWARASLEGLK